MNSNPFTPMLSRYVQVHSGDEVWLGKLESVEIYGPQIFATLSDASPLTNGDYAQISAPLTTEEWLQTGRGAYSAGPDVCARGVAVVRLDGLREIPGPG